jgi:hypothetical protein
VIAVVPLNVAALRVRSDDATGVTPRFKGRTAWFENVPYPGHHETTANTGDAVFMDLADQAGTQDSLGPGIHLHWELPDHFRRGMQPPAGGPVVFPAAPNRWLVIRYLRVRAGAAGALGPVRTAAWVVESDRLSPEAQTDSRQKPPARPAVTVPIPLKTNQGTQPYQMLGRVLPLDAWREGSDSSARYLAEPLTAIGFVGPAFSAYYPECSSVFGFWDRFLDAPDINGAITANNRLHFVASYHVIGWVHDAKVDPLAGLAADAMQAYRTRAEHCVVEHVPVDTSFPHEFVDLAARRLRWAFRAEELATVSASSAVPTAPSRALCSGIIQEVRWDFAADGSDVGFLANPRGADTAVWNDSVAITVGRTTQEALAATLRADLGGGTTDPDVQHNDEFLIHALLLGLLYGLEQKTNKIVELEEALHGQAFARVNGGHLWAVQARAAEQEDADPDAEIDLPLAVAEALAELNLAQKAYDQARAALAAMRNQLFMDWFRYVQAEAAGDTTLSNRLSTFLTRGGISPIGDGALAVVHRAGQHTGVLEQNVSKEGDISVRGSPDGSLASQVVALHAKVVAAIPGGVDWVLRQVPAPAFWLPGEPVLLLSKGKLIEPVRRNGPGESIAVRVDGQLIDRIVASDATSFTIDAATLTELLPASMDNRLPLPDVIRRVAAEALLLMPSLADLVAAKGGSGNPGAASLATAQARLFSAVRADGAVAAANPKQTSGAIIFTFTNETGNGWAPDPVGWSCQTALPEFSATRLDPFLPVSLVWEAAVTPLKHAAGKDYSAANLTDYFRLDDDGVDWSARLEHGNAVPLLGEATITYGGSVILSRRPTISLGQQIDTYLADHPRDPDHPETDPGPELRKIKADYAQSRMLSQGLSGLSAQLTLRRFVARTPVVDLVDTTGVTARIGTEAQATSADNWYDGFFNAHAPVYDDPRAAYFGPLFAGMMQVTRLEIVDVFGQRLSLTTPTGPMRCNPAMSLKPPPGLPPGLGDVFLSPRLLAPTRLWFRWLSAATPADRSDGFVEMNTHPATSPVCGWILPNHLDNSLAFYDADGTPIGSFGLEAGGTRYRTRPGNLDNVLENNIHSANPHLARFMRYVAAAPEGFLGDLMATILATDATIFPGGAREDASLAVFIGRPLALARAVLGLETQGGVLPLSQADTDADGPFRLAINGQKTAYADREAIASARLADVVFPLRLGDIANLEDGMVGYLPETATGGYTAFYSAQAPAVGSHGVVRPDLSTLPLRLDEAPGVVSMLLDPRAAVHATSGILPVQELRIPPDQYAAVLRGLAVTFIAHPLLRGHHGRVVPLPEEAGYEWSWISPRGDANGPLRANAAEDTAITDYSPQLLEEGWLCLTPSPRRN